MTVWCVGSINADYFYSVDHLVRPGETLAAAAFQTGLGGKGANQSVAAARAGAFVNHIGAVGPDSRWALERMAGLGVDVTNVAEITEPMGHAIIMVDRDGENAIVIYPGANRALNPGDIAAALDRARPGDTLLMQNETSCQAEAAEIARKRGLTVVYSAAPFDIRAVEAVLPHVTILVMNEGEAAALCASLDTTLDDLPVPQVLVTKGAKGAALRTQEGWLNVPALAVEPVDTTGAGDTFAGYFAAALDEGAGAMAALELATAAAALKVTRPGTADAIPDREEVDAFRA